MEFVDRIDAGQLLKAHKTPEGYLLAEGYAGRAGVLTYRMADGSTRRELIPPEELFRPDSLGTLGRKPVTLDHPKDANGKAVNVNSTNVDAYGVGDVDGELVEDVAGGFVRVRVAIRRADAVAAVESGRMRGLSQGYRCRLEELPGVWNGQPYDAVQRDRVYEHLAICQMGRAGYDARLRVDDAGSQIDAIDGPAWPDQHREDTMTLEINGVRYDAESVTKLQADLAAAHADAETARTDAATNKAQYDALQKKMDECKATHDANMAEMEKEKNRLADNLAAAEAAKKAAEEAKNNATKSDSAEFLAQFSERQQLLGMATRFKIDGAETLANSEIQRQIVQIHNPEIKLDSESADYPATYVRALGVQLVKAEAGQRGVAGATSGGQTSGTRTDARAEAMATYKQNVYGE